MQEVFAVFCDFDAVDATDSLVDTSGMQAIRSQHQEIRRCLPIPDHSLSIEHKVVLQSKPNAPDKYRRPCWTDLCTVNAVVPSQDHSSLEELPGERQAQRTETGAD